MRILIILAALLATPCFLPAQGASIGISSPAFQNNHSIPSRYACDGVNVNPPLMIQNVPGGTKSLALVLDDIDAPRGTYVHWILWNISPAEREIQENSVPEGAVQGLNDFRKNSYGGPCPPGRAHRYLFRIYALDFSPKLDPRSTKADLEKIIEGHVLGRGEMVGKYQKIQKTKK
ncbi:MAG TPA: YbhB/YbcL family Raf kinase inhibitor-like protein [Thermodesulfobacteriota bacterium]|nr:YbhB/YbcL family Raf kinase inhibitor-like protein [Thermodesulfobacteriota bacterium]